MLATSSPTTYATLAQGRHSAPSHSARSTTFSVLGDDAVAALLQSFYAGGGLWRDCPQSRCAVRNGDWGSDSLTDTLYMRWKTSRDPAEPLLLAELAATARSYGPPCRADARCELWSDVPMWDSVAASHEHEATSGDVVALRKAENAFWAVEGAEAYARGACPQIRYQRPFGRGDHLKTLETDSNGIKAALLLFEATRQTRYLAIARERYEAVRRYFLDSEIPLYSVYVFDDGKQCRQASHRYFASVNGNMIWNGLHLARLSGVDSYRTQALATARAVERYLSDANGVFTDLQAENDLEQPLIEAMLEVATTQRDPLARQWILRGAAAAYSARRVDGTFGRFFDGPPPAATATAWQSNGGFAAEIAAASLAPAETVRPTGWGDATFVADEITRLPATIHFWGSGIALIGTLGDRCCESGHARVMIDGVETTNGVGTWQNKSSSGQRIPDSVLFAWRWPSAGRHEITFEPGAYDAKEGGSFLHARGYALLSPRTFAASHEERSAF
jgi:hypothetical protein